MKLILFHPQSLFCAWAVSTGLGDALARLGHHVTVCPINATLPSIDKARYPSFKELQQAEGIIVSGPEHINKHILALYQDWESLTTPKVAWMHETVSREDYGKKLSPSGFRRFVKNTFCSAVQDEEYGFRWLPFGVDTEVFKPNWGQPKQWDVAFIGYLYPKRREFLDRVLPHLNGINLICGNVQVQDLDGVNLRMTAALYADTLRKIKVFVNFPSLTEVLVTKVTEAQACGTFLVTPTMHHQRNNEGIQARFYDPEKPETLAEGIRMALEHEQEREQAARLCCEQVHRLHKLEYRCEVLLEAMKN